jgi:hypothetical protein
MTEALKQVNENSLIIKAKAIAKKFADSMTKAVAEIEKLEKGLSKNPAVDAELRKYNEEVSLDKNLNEFKKMTVSFKTHDMMSKASTDLAKQGFTISGNQKALKVNGNGADLNKYATDLQNNYGATVRAESYTIDESADEDSYNPITEDVSLDEASLKDIFTANQEGKKAEDIAKKLNMSVADVKKILGEETLHEFTDAQISQLKKEYEPLKGKTISGPNATKLMKIFDKFEKNKQLLVKILKADIPFVSMLAQARLIRVHGANSSQLAQMRKEELEEEDGKIGKEKDTDGLEKQLTAAQGQITVLKQKIENEKNKAIKPMPNPETGEVPLTIGIANKLLKDKEAKEAAAKTEAEEKEKSDKKKTIAKFKDRIKESLNLDESEASDKAKGMGLTYMKFGRYGADGKVTHKSIGGNLTKVGKDEKPIKEPKSDKSKDEPKKDKSKSSGTGGKSSITLGDLDGSDKDLQKLIKKSGLKMKSKDGMQGDDITLSGDEKEIEKVLDTMYGDDWKDIYQKKDGKYVEKDEDKPEKQKSQVDSFTAKKDLEKNITDGTIDIKTRDDGTLNMVKEYEPSQEYDAEEDVKTIKKYLKDKGVSKDDIYIDVEGGEDDEFLAVTVEVRPKGVKKEMKEGKLPGAGTGIIKKYSRWKLQPGGGMYPRYKHPKHGEINIDRYGGWMHYDKNNKKVAFYSPAGPNNKFNNAGATSMDFDVYFKLKKLDESISTKNEEKRLYVESIIKKSRIKK